MSENERLDWNEYFMSIAKLASIRSACSRLKVGCVIVKDKHVVSMGYNGFLPSFPHESIVINDHEQATVHAEQNAIADAACRGTSVNNGTAYITHYPCINCFKILIASGIKQIYYLNDYNNNNIIDKLLEKNSSITLKKIEHITYL